MRRPPGVSHAKSAIGPELTLTPRDQALLVALCRRVRCLSAGQITRHWWGRTPGAAASARRRLRQLVAAGYLDSETVMAGPPIVAEMPVARWQIGEPPPDFASIAHRLKVRQPIPPQATTVYFATPIAARRFAGKAGRAPRRSEATHDLSLAAVFLHFLASTPERAAKWTSEAELAARGEGRGRKLADALIEEPNGIATVIELGGEYDKAKLRAFHDDCAARSRHYELW